MPTSPALFTDFGRNAKDVLKKDNIPDRTLYSYFGGLLKLPRIKRLAYTEKIDSSTRVVATFKLPNLTSSKLEFQHFQPHATHTIAKALNRFYDISTTIGNPKFALGAKVRYHPHSNEFTKYAVGINVTEPNSCTSVILSDKGDAVKLWYICHPDGSKTNALAVEIKKRLSTNEMSYIVGGTYAVDKLTVVKANVNNYGKVGAVLERKVNPDITLTYSAELDTKDLKKTPRFAVFIRGI